MPLRVTGWPWANICSFLFFFNKKWRQRLTTLRLMFYNDCFITAIQWHVVSIIVRMLVIFWVVFAALTCILYVPGFLDWLLDFLALSLCGQGPQFNQCLISAHSVDVKVGLGVGKEIATWAPSYTINQLFMSHVFKFSYWRHFHQANKTIGFSYIVKLIVLARFHSSLCLLNHLL